MGECTQATCAREVSYSFVCACMFCITRAAAAASCAVAAAAVAAAVLLVGDRRSSSMGSVMSGTSRVRAELDRRDATGADERKAEVDEATEDEGDEETLAPEADAAADAAAAIAMAVALLPLMTGLKAEKVCSVLHDVGLAVGSRSGEGAAV